MGNSTAFCMPLLLRRCLLDNLSGTLVVAERGGRGWTHTIHLRDRAAVCVTSTERTPRPGERAEAYICERISSLFLVREAEVALERSTSPVVGLTAAVPV